jgi:hypothetical protein
MTNSEGESEARQCYFRLAELLHAVPSEGRASQAARQAGTERPQMVCNR